VGHNESNKSTEAQRLCDALEQRFGTFMTSAEVRGELKFKSASAFAMARKRGHVQLLPTKMPGRRQFLYPTKDVARLLARIALAAGNEFAAPRGTR
jgi:hypothetical protein